MEIKIIIPDEAVKVLDSWLGVGKFQDWLQHAANNKIRQRVNASLIEQTNLNPKKLSEEEKLNTLSGIKLLTREERNNMEGRYL